MKTRRLFLSVHRYIGVSIAAFMIISGLTGSILAFDPEIDAAFSPEYFGIEEVGEKILGPRELAAHIEASDSRIWVRYIPLPDDPRKAIVAYVAPRKDPTTGDYFDVDYDEVFVNPVTGEVKGHRMWGQCCERHNFVPFVHKLHNRLALPASIGRPIWGAIGALWALTSIFGIYLTLPIVKPKFRRWREVWKFKRGLPYLQMNLQIHRATGLWFSLVSLPVAISGIGLAMYADVFRPVVSRFSPITETVWEQRAGEASRELVDPQVSFDEALITAVNRADSLGLSASSSAISYSDHRGLYRIDFGDRLSTGLGLSRVYVDASNGLVAGHSLAGSGSVGDTLDSVVQPLHSGRVIGMPGRVIVFFLGLAVVLLASTGVMMWWRKLIVH